MSRIRRWPGQNRISTVCRLACPLAALSAVAFSLIRRSAIVRVRGSIVLIVAAAALAVPLSALPVTDAAAAGAAYTALVALIPAQKPLFDAQLAATLARLSDDPARPGTSVERGLAWGETVANDILAWRATDGFNAVLPPYV